LICYPRESVRLWQIAAIASADMFAANQMFWEKKQTNKQSKKTHFFLEFTDQHTVLPFCMLLNCITQLLSLL